MQTSTSLALPRRLFGCLAFGLTTVLLAVHPAAAQNPAVGFIPNAIGAEDNAANTLGSPTGSQSIGFEFTADADAVVSALGYFNDPSFDPNNPFNSVYLSPKLTGSYTFAGSHVVGLYQGSTLLASATVTSSSTSQGNFLYESITPVQLVAGGDYVLAGVTGPTDPYVYDVQDNSIANSSGLTTNGITYVQDRYDPSSTLVRPTQTDAGSEWGFFGPNLLLSPVPEASPAVSLGLLLACGLSGMVVVARRRRTA